MMNGLPIYRQMVGDFSKHQAEPGILWWAVVAVALMHNYEERTLAIEIFDNKPHELVWTGRMTKESSGKINPEKLKEAISTILAKFPPTSTQPK
jgi:hypothetical protein